MEKMHYAVGCLRTLYRFPSMYDVHSFLCRLAAAYQLMLEKIQLTHDVPLRALLALAAHPPTHSAGVQ